MQTFIDTATQKVYAFNDDVNVLDVGGVYSFTTAADVPLKLPATLQPYTPPAPTAADIAAQALRAAVANAFAAGLQITCTSTPAIDSTYALDQTTQAKINAIETAVMKNGVFPGSSGAQLAFPDIAGVFHVFPSVTIWGEFATAVANYVTDLELYAAGAPGATLPSTAVTIA